MRLLLSAAVIAGICMTSDPEIVEGAHLSIYSDPALTQCTLSDASPGAVSIYVAETTDEATGVRFRVAPSPGFTGVWLGDSSPYHPIGSSQTDLSLGYGACLDGKFLVLTLTYQMFGTSTCSELAIAPAVGFPVSICVPCFGETPCIGDEPLHVNCSGSFDCNPLPVEPSTWGSVKALYRN
jgi:hypothetical protein